jgi:hypothetical protein
MDIAAFIATIEAERRKLPRGDRESALALLKQCQEAERLIHEQCRKIEQRAYRPTAEEQKARRAYREDQFQVMDGRAQEREAESKLGLRLIDIGYRTIAREMHPDQSGGSHAAMTRLNRARDRLKANV